VEALSPPTTLATLPLAPDDCAVDGVVLLLVVPAAATAVTAAATPAFDALAPAITPI
jgi:phage-related minor tail protein